jgi:hypothetical protein
MGTSMAEKKVKLIEWSEKMMVATNIPPNLQMGKLRTAVKVCLVVVMVVLH